MSYSLFALYVVTNAFTKTNVGRFLPRCIQIEDEKSGFCIMFLSRSLDAFHVSHLALLPYAFLVWFLPNYDSICPAFSPFPYPRHYLLIKRINECFVYLYYSFLYVIGYIGRNIKWGCIISF